MKRHQAGVLLIAVAVAVSFVVIDSAYAGNATRMLGFSSRDSGMGGATTASPADTSCLIKNPAGLVPIGNRVDVQYLNILPHDVSMHTEGAYSRQGTIQKSTIDYLPGINAGVSYRLPGTEKHPIALGCGIFTIAGVAVDYPSSRLNLALGGNANGVYDRMTDLREMRVTPGLAVGITDKLSFGLTGNIELQALKCDFAKASDFQETAGSGQWDIIPGGGFTLGLLYQVNDMVGLGASYESHTWMQHHHKYKDVLPYVDGPQIINAGVSLKPIKPLELTFDTRYINWTDVKLARLAPVAGGFGWRDQWVFATGGEYTTLQDKLKLRLGYNYGKSPIQPHVVFANALLPVVMEHHLTTGFSYMVMKNLSVDFAWEHHFMGVKADNGAGDTFSINGVGTKVTAAAEVITAGLSYTF